MIRIYGIYVGVLLVLIVILAVSIFHNIQGGQKDIVAPTQTPLSVEALATQIAQLAPTAVQTPTPVRAGPEIERFTVEPRTGKVGDTLIVDVAIKKIPGATRLLASCGRIGHFEQPEIQAYTTAWDTKDCAPGKQAIRLITRWQGDSGWKAWPDSRVVEISLLPSPQVLDTPPPEARLRVDRGDGKAFHAGIHQGQCVILSWKTRNATEARLDGQLAPLQGSRHECPKVTSYYTLEAFGADRDDRSNSIVSVVVTQ